MTVHLVFPLEYKGTRVSAKKKRLKAKGYSLDMRTNGLSKKKHSDSLVAHIRWLYEKQGYSMAEISEAFQEIVGYSQIYSILTYMCRHRIDPAPCIEYMDRL